MNVYDFDETIYDGDCTRDFIFYCIKRYPAMLRVVPKLMITTPQFLLKKMDKTTFKQGVYSCLRYIPNIDEVIEDFVDANQSKIKKWYLLQYRKDDLIISASPEFLIGSFCRRLDIEYMASLVDNKTGQYTGLNCYGEEKVVRYDQKYSRDDIEDFYSDSRSDDPLAKIAKKAYLVTGNEIKEW